MGKYYNSYAQRRPDVSKLPNMTVQIELTDVEEFINLMKANSKVDEFAAMVNRMPCISAIQILHGDVLEMYVFRCGEENGKKPNKKKNRRYTVDHYDRESEFSDFSASMVVHANETNKGILFDEVSKVPNKFKLEELAQFIGDIFLYIHHVKPEKKTRIYKIDLSFLRFGK